ncbi:MAG: hypothetical protein A2133_01970 [Actinobacteria bacterium RBG_16_64_13]|nr:MAG: hypothetical protein A2133_01970 [Actinobacteria bacterium RBG_16_64_13]
MAVRSWHLQNKRDMREGRVPYYSSEPLVADLPLARVLVAVSPGGEGHRRIVEVDEPYSRKQSQVLQLAYQRVQAICLVHGVPGRKQVGGVETHPDGGRLRRRYPTRGSERNHQDRQLLQPPAHCVSCARARLE